MRIFRGAQKREGWGFCWPDRLSDDRSLSVSACRELHAQFVTKELDVGRLAAKVLPVILSLV